MLAAEANKKLIFSWRFADFITKTFSNLRNELSNHHE